MDFSKSWLDDRFVPLTHPLLLDELRAVTRQPRIHGLIRPPEAGRLANQIRALAEPVAGLPRPAAPTIRPTTS